MHYYLADLAARKLDNQARALLLDREGRITETSTANVVLYRDGEGLLSPRRETGLPGISLMFLQELAAKRHIPFAERDLFLDDALAADEVLLTSTPNCLLPVVALNGQPIGEGKPGSLFRQLLKVWSEAVGVDIALQARRYAAR